MSWSVSHQPETNNKTDRECFLLFPNYSTFSIAKKFFFSRDGTVSSSDLFQTHLKGKVKVVDCPVCTRFFSAALIEALFTQFKFKH